MEYIARQDIDIAKWDACINASANGLVYGLSIYLDHMAKQWDALVYNDYEAVMPLTWNRKYGIKYLYQPSFTQQLGIFSTVPVSEQLTELFISNIKQYFEFAEIFLNYGNRHHVFKPRPNYILPLKNSYSQIQRSYKRILHKNLRRASNAKLSYRMMHDINTVVNTYKTIYGERFSHVKKHEYEQFVRLCIQMQNENALILRGAYTIADALAGCILLLRHKNRLHLLQSATVNEGRSLQASHFLINNLIEEFAGRDLILDFEGSSVPGIAEFFKNFGATEEPYFFFRYNGLPWPLRLLK